LTRIGPERLALSGGVIGLYEPGAEVSGELRLHDLGIAAMDIGEDTGDLAAFKSIAADNRAIVRSSSEQVPALLEGRKQPRRLCGARGGHDDTGC
jgi:hypothetical protein